ncbi:MAG: hypothetical protein ABIQ15_17505 [Nocardioides sp.]
MTMCRAVRCRTCGKATWAGCGDHIEEALAGISTDDRCPGHESDGSASADGGFLSRVFGR